jgi:hypothetical protein
MGKNDNRRSKKMRRRVRQRKFQERVVRRRTRLRGERETAVAAAPVKKRERKDTLPRPAKEPREAKPAGETAPAGEPVTE